LRPLIAAQLSAGMGDSSTRANSKLRVGRLLGPRCRAVLCDRHAPEPMAGRVFLCPRCRAVLCDARPVRRARGLDWEVSMPSMSGWGFVTVRVGNAAASQTQKFLCPRCRAGLCDLVVDSPFGPLIRGFYALDVGLGFVTDAFGRCLLPGPLRPVAPSSPEQASEGNPFRLSSENLALSCGFARANRDPLRPYDRVLYRSCRARQLLCG
jgi:hypothetical protein